MEDVDPSGRDWEVWLATRNLLIHIGVYDFESRWTVGVKKIKKIFNLVKSDYENSKLEDMDPECKEITEFIRRNRKNLEYILLENDRRDSNWVKIEPLKCMDSNLTISIK